MQIYSVISRMFDWKHWIRMNLSKRLTILFWTSILLIITSNCDSASDVENFSNELLLIQVVHRHGERTAVFDIPVAGNESTQGRPLEAQLTPEGVRAMYEYGRFMRQRYRAFLENGERGSTQRIKVISSATDRTISSAQALIAGLLPPNGTMRQWNSSLGVFWTPFPIYSQPSRHDSLLLNFGDDCPIFTTLRQSIVTDLPIALKLQEEMKNFIDAVVLATGIKNYKFFETSTFLEDALHYQHLYPDPGGWPTWVNATVYKEFKRIADFRMHMTVGGNGDHRRTRFRVGYLLHEIFQRMNYSSQNPTDSSTRKMVLYSGHDENVAGILAALDLFNYTLEGPNFGIPEFTASVIFELYKNNTVRVLLKNNPENMWAEPQVLVHPQCTVFCPLEKLRTILKDMIATDDQWQQECGLFPPEKPNGRVGLPEAIIIAGVLIACAVIFMISLIIWLFFSRCYRTVSATCSTCSNTGFVPLAVQNNKP